MLTYESPWWRDVGEDGLLLPLEAGGSSSNDSAKEQQRQLNRELWEQWKEQQHAGEQQQQAGEQQPAPQPQPPPPPAAAVRATAGPASASAQRPDFSDQLPPEQQRRWFFWQ